MDSYRRHMNRLLEARVNLAYQAFMLFLCVYALLALSAEVLLPAPMQDRAVLDYVDYFVCAIFFIDFIMNFIGAEHKWRYLRTWGWIDLLSSIPNVQALRLGRLARILRILRLLRALRVTRFVVAHLVRQHKGAVLYGAAVVAFTMVIMGSIAVLTFENTPQANIHTASDALWWAICTIATVGYGDFYPVTWEGRAVAVMLMTVGVGMIGVLSGAMVSWFVQPDYRREQDEIRHLRREIAELTEWVKSNAGVDRRD